MHDGLLLRATSTSTKKGAIIQTRYKMPSLRVIVSREKIMHFPESIFKDIDYLTMNDHTSR